MERVRSGGRAYVPLEVLHLENLDRVLARHALSERVDAAARAEMNRAWERLPAWPDAVAGLAALREGLILAPCSNGSIAMMVRLARFAGLPWDCVLGADIARAYKPDPAVYRASVAALGLAPEEVIMVAAHEDDLSAARAEGLATAFVPRPAEFGPDRRADPGPSGDWDLVAEDVPALARRLAG
jgi:2-haloacid dehalogenase